MAAVIRAFEKYPVVNRAYADVRGEIESALDIWNSENPDRKFGALDLWLMGYFHYCIPFAAQPKDLGADHKDVRQRMRDILYPILESKKDDLTPEKYAKILTRKSNINVYLERMIASRTDNPKIMPYIIPGTSTTFKNLYDAGYVRVGDIVILRARGKNYEATINKNGKVELYIGANFQLFDSVTEAGLKGLEYPGFNQWSSSHAISAKGKILLGELRERFKNERPFPEHFDSPIVNINSAAENLSSGMPAFYEDEFYEGSIRRISVEVRERDASARMACILHYKCKCWICGFDFGMFYGSEAEGFIHVHHREQLAKAAGRRRVDPIEDLVPLCPNCHSVVHLRKKAYEVDEVKKMVERQKRIGK
jgi:5-methylcytosine-specific restriction endonuclease McrA